MTIVTKQKQLGNKIKIILKIQIQTESKTKCQNDTNYHL